MSRPTPPAYKTRNWPAYNEALKRRGSLTIWFDPSMIWEAAPTGKRAVVSQMLWKFPGGGLRACEGSVFQAARSRGIGSMG